MTPTLIRNIDKQFCDEFLCHGRLRLKPVTGYNDIADPARADKTEGTRGMEAHPQSNITLYGDQLWTPGGISLQGTKQDARPFFCAGAGAIISFFEIIPQAYVLCLSEERIRKFGDAAFVVNDPMQFGLRVLIALNASGRKILKWRLAKVRYVGHKDAITNQAEFENASTSMMETDYSEGYFTKPTGYAVEREWRYIFVVEDQESALADVDICDESLIELCERHTEV